MDVAQGREFSVRPPSVCEQLKRQIYNLLVVLMSINVMTTMILTFMNNYTNDDDDGNY